MGSMPTILCGDLTFRPSSPCVSSAVLRPSSCLTSGSSNCRPCCCAFGVLPPPEEGESGVAADFGVVTFSLVLAVEPADKTRLSSSACVGSDSSSSPVSLGIMYELISGNGSRYDAETDGCWVKAVAMGVIQSRGAKCFGEGSR